MNTPTLEHLYQDLKNLKPQDLGAIVPLAIHVNQALLPEDNFENCFRQLKFIGCELKQECQELSKIERWQWLRDYFFNKKGYTCESNLWVNAILQNRSGHPLALSALLVCLASTVDLPLQLVQARHHYIARLIIDSQTHYFDLLHRGESLSDDNLVKILHRSSSNLEVWDARQLLIGYLEELSRQLEMCDDWSRLLMVYDFYLQLDETSTSVIGLRGLLRYKLGMSREALSDLKRYFSFVERTRAPAEMREALLELEMQKHVPPPPAELVH